MLTSSTPPLSGTASGAIPTQSRLQAKQQFHLHSCASPTRVSMATLATAPRTCCTLDSSAMRPCLARTAPTGKRAMSHNLKPASSHWVIRSSRVLEPQPAAALAEVLAEVLAPAPGRVTASGLPADLTMTARMTSFAATASVRRSESLPCIRGPLSSSRRQYAKRN